MSGVAVCGECGRTFRSVAGFDMHRVGAYATLPDSKHGARPHQRRCLSDDEMRERGMLTNERGQWVTAAMPTGRLWQQDDEEATA